MSPVRTKRSSGWTGGVGNRDGIGSIGGSTADRHVLLGGFSSMIRIGIVGCGRILAAHLRGYRLLRQAGDRDFHVAALCSRRERDVWSFVRRGEGPPQLPPCSNIPGDPLTIGDEYLSDFQDTSDVEIYSDYRTMIERGKVDAVMDLTSHGMHHRVAAHAFAHRKHLLSQKPLAATVRLAQRMCEQAAEADCLFGTFECFRFLPESRALDWLFRTARGGSLQMILLDISARGGRRSDRREHPVAPSPGGGGRNHARSRCAFFLTKCVWSRVVRPPSREMFLSSNVDGSRGIRRESSSIRSTVIRTIPVSQRRHLRRAPSRIYQPVGQDTAGQR